MEWENLSEKITLRIIGNMLEWETGNICCISAVNKDPI